jgi:sodium transport system ATP-binding protein
MIQVNALEKSFGPVSALNGISFAAGDGRITGLLGPNGAGKSTTLRILYTVLKPDKGSALIDGFNSTEQAHVVRSRIGVLPHASGIYQRLTARENIAYYGRLYGLKKPVLNKRIEELVDMLDMGDFADRQAQGYSQGQRIKVALARALVHKPANIMLDEPGTGLDVLSTRALRGYIKQLRDEGLCILFSSHVMQEVSALCDHVVIIDHGAVVAQGTPEQIKSVSGRDNLEDAFVALSGPAGETDLC